MLPAPSDQIAGFNSIDGLSETDIYAVGWQGEIWHFDDKKWESIPSPTNLKLERVICAPNETVYAVGQAGILLRGHQDRWEVVEHGATEEQFWGAEWYKGHLWVSTQSAVYTLNDKDGLDAVDFGLEEPPTCRSLVSGDGVLWSIGSMHLLSTQNGIQWTQIIL